MDKRPTIGDARYNFKYIKPKADNFVKKINSTKNFKHQVNASCLFLVIRSALDDIWRYKMYHLEDPTQYKSNSVKRSAYFSKWINKLKPIEYQTEIPTNEDEKGITINAYFSIILSQSYISTETNNYFKISNNYRHELLYDFVYREMNEDAYLHIYQNIHNVVRGNDIIDEI